MKKSTSLGVKDWVMAAFRALTLEGPQGIRVEAIARALKVSKGSFYWHFKDVAALKTAMLSHWEQAGTRDVIDKIQLTQVEARDQLFALVDLSASFDDPEIGGVLAEAAIRDWARYYGPAAVALKKADIERMAFVVQLFGQYGFSHELAKSHARLLYAGLIGMAHLAHQDLADMHRDLRALLELILATSPESKRA